MTAAIPAIASLLVVPFPALWMGILGMNALMALVWIWDLASIPRAGWFQAQRVLTKITSDDQWHEAMIRLDVRAPKSVTVTVWEEVPRSVEVAQLPFQCEVNGWERLEVAYKLKPLQRGRHQLTATWVLAQTRAGFWQRQIRLAHESEHHVYPNLRRLESFKLLARSNRENMMGVKKVRKLGGDQEFDRLRDYILGDEYRDIDWRATAKRRQLTVRTYRQEENQNIVVMLDCGRMMTSVENDLSLLDHAINAGLLMSHIALKQGDRVGMVAFASDILSQVPIKGGSGHLKQLIHASYNLFPRHEESHFDHAFLHVKKTFHKRALLILVTHILDQVNADRVVTHLTNLTGKHLPLCVSYQEPALRDVLAQRPTDAASFYQLAAAAQISEWNRKVMSDLKSRGVLVLETEPHMLSAKLINTYLDIKARHLL